MDIHPTTGSLSSEVMCSYVLANIIMHTCRACRKHSFKTSVTLLWCDMQLHISKHYNHSVSYTHMDIYPTPVGEVHGPGYPAFPNCDKLQTGPWQSFEGTTTHQSLPLDETAPKDQVSRSRWNRIFEIPYFKEFCLSRPSYFSKNRQKIIKRNFAGLHPAPRPYGAAPLPPTKVDAKRVAAVVLDNPDRALR